MNRLPAQSNNFLWFIFVIIIGLTFYPFFKVGFTTGDDLSYYMRYLSGGIMADAQDYAKTAGRFYFLITKPIYLFPYIFGNFYVTKLIQYGSLLLSFGLSGYLIKKIFRSKELGLFTFLLLLVLLVITPNFHIPITAYPFYFSFSFSIFLCSLIFLVKYTETDRYKYLICSAILFTISLLFYETFLIFLVFIGVYILIRNINISGKRIFGSKKFYKELLPFVIVGVSYILIYFIYRAVIHEDQFYNGSSFAEEFSLTGFFKVLINYNKANIPFYTYDTYNYIIREVSTLEGGNRADFKYILINSDIANIVNALLQCYIFVYLFLKIRSDISWKKIIISVITSVLFMFSCHILIAMSQKYNMDPYWNNVEGYVTTYYSYFAVIFIIALLVYCIYKLFYKFKWLRYPVLGAFTILLFYVSIINSYSNEYLSKDWQHSRNGFRLIDMFCENGVFNEIPENTIIYASDLYKTTSISGHNIFLNWSDYIYLKTGRRLNLYNNNEEFISAIRNEPGKDIYYISKYETLKNNDMLYVFSKVNENSIDLTNPEKLFINATTNNADVHYYSIFKSFKFHFFIPQTGGNAIIRVNDNGPAKGINGFNNLIISGKNTKEKITSFRINSTEPFSVMNFRISNIGYVSPDEPVYTSY